MPTSSSTTKAPAAIPRGPELFNYLAEANQIKINIESLQSDLSLLQGQFMHPGRNHLDIFAAHNLIKHDKFNDLIFRADTLVEGIEKRQNDKKEGKSVNGKHIQRAIKEFKALDAAFISLADELVILKKALEDRSKEGDAPFHYPPDVFFNLLRDSVTGSTTQTPETSTSISNSEPAPPVSTTKKKTTSSKPKVRTSIVQATHAKSPSPLRQVVNAEVTITNAQKSPPLKYTGYSAAPQQDQNKASEPPSSEQSLLDRTPPPSMCQRKSSRVAKLPRKSYASNSDSDLSTSKAEDIPRPIKKPIISKIKATASFGNSSSSNSVPQGESEAHIQQLERRLAAAENRSRELWDEVGRLKKESLKMKKEEIASRNEIKDLQGEISVFEQQVATLSNNLRGRQNYYQPPKPVATPRLEKRKTHQWDFAWGEDDNKILAEGGKRRRLS